MEDKNDDAGKAQFFVITAISGILLTRTFPYAGGPSQTRTGIKRSHGILRSCRAIRRKRKGKDDEKGERSATRRSVIL
jgi:hypothetical protein